MRPFIAVFSVFAVLSGLPRLAAAQERVDLRRATIVVRPGERSPVERMAAQVLQEEVRARLGVTLPIATTWPSGGDTSIALSAVPDVAAWTAKLPARTGDVPERRPEGYRVVVQPSVKIVWILGADERGALFGVGELLRALRWGGREGDASGVPADLDVATAPRYPIRGHQLGYRHHSNTYDAWDARRYEQYIRELALFGVNSIENIPFQDTRVSPHFPLSRAAMTRAVSEICARYGLDYWIWTPIDFDLNDAAKRAQGLVTLDETFRTLPRLDAVFFPGGDPGDNPAPLVVPYLAEAATRLVRHHPRAKVWLSLQQFDEREIDLVFAYVRREQPSWLGGLVAGPSSPPMASMRARLDARYPIRDYPDVTHTVRCQFPVPWWDPALGVTYGREPINPRPVFYAAIHDRTAPHTSGFISYSDGVNDDVNKIVWSRKAWALESEPRPILIEYARVFFGQAAAERAADGILALEKNWEGPLATNGSVDGTLAAWQALEREQPALADNWRWQMYLLRAYYDAYTRHRLIAETAIAREAERALAIASTRGSAAAIDTALAVLARKVSPTRRAGETAAAESTRREEGATPPGCCPEWRQRIDALCDALFRSIGMQTSVTKYGASGAERGAVLDFVDYPLNNRWWLEDELAKVRAMPDEAARVARLDRLRTWDSPGPGSFYDDVGHVGRGPHVVRARATSADPFVEAGPIPHFTWEDQGLSRKRLSWLTSLRWPLALVYDAVDPKATYVVRLNGTGDVRLKIDGASATASTYSRIIGEPKEYPVPAAALEDGRVVLTFDPIDESHVNWRQYSRLSEVWLIRMSPGSP